MRRGGLLRNHGDLSSISLQDILGSLGLFFFLIFFFRHSFKSTHIFWAKMDWHGNLSEACEMHLLLHLKRKSSFSHIISKWLHLRILFRGSRFWEVLSHLHVGSTDKELKSSKNLALLVETDRGSSIVIFYVLLNKKLLHNAKNTWLVAKINLWRVKFENENK